MPEVVSHYRLLRKLGTGGMGTVYLARDERTGDTVAIKVLHPHLAADFEYVKRFQREARIARSIESPHVVRVLEAGQDGEHYFLVMEYVEGRSLAEVLREEGALPIDRAVNIAEQIAMALAKADEMGVVHRDVKPANAIVTPDWQVKVADFGVARALGQTAMTSTGMMLGTPQYMSPDHTSGHLDIRSDIYSLGVVLYQMLAGAAPFQADTPWAVMRMHETKPPPRLHAARPEVPAWLDAIVQRCLQKSPEDRFLTPTDLYKALDAGPAGLQIPIARPRVGDLDGSSRPATIATKKSGGWEPRVLALIGVASVLVVAIVAGAVLLSGGHGGSGAIVVAVTPKASADTASSGPTAHVPTVSATPTSSGAQPLTYIVQNGDTFGAIAARFGVSLDVLRQANRLIYQDLISVGQVLVIPGGGTSSLPVATREGIVYIDDAAGNNVLLSDTGAGATSVTLASNVSAQHPDLSPNGTKLLFVRGDSSNSSSSIFLLDLSTGAEREVLQRQDGWLMHSPIWISDGEFLYQIGRWNGTDDEPNTSSIRRHMIESSDADPSNDTNVISARDVQQSPLLLDSTAEIESFDVGPGAGWFVFQVCYYVDASSKGCGVYRLSIGAPPSTMQAVVPLSGTQVSGYPAVSPDGSLVAVQAYPGDGSSPIEIWKTDGSGMTTRLTDTSLRAYNHPPYWSKMAWTPDGQSIVFEYYDSSSGDWLYEQNIDGGAPRPLFHGRQPVSGSIAHH